MKKLITMVGLALSFMVAADDHATQMLHPYWGGGAEEFDRYMKNLKDPVNSYVTTYDGRNDEDYGALTHLFFYAVNIPGAKSFSVDVACPDNEPSRVYGLKQQPEAPRLADLGGVMADPVKNNPEPIITEAGQVLWRLDPNGGKQGMWFYSNAKVMARTYSVSFSGPEGRLEVRTGTVDGPSCVLE